jgi:uncharacterized cupin superfamily protein
MLDDSPVPEATLTRADHGLVPEGDGWFIVNVTEAQAAHSERFGMACRFEGPDEFPEFGINLRVLEPGQPNGLYHRENAQEAFLVLSGECRAIVEEQERPMRAGDFFYTPPNTAHVLVGAGDGPCAILMVGTRKGADEELLYPVSVVAGHYGASADRATDDAATAYAGSPAREPTTLPLAW